MVSTLERERSTTRTLSRSGYEKSVLDLMRAAGESTAIDDFSSRRGRDVSDAKRRAYLAFAARAGMLSVDELQAALPLWRQAIAAFVQGYRSLWNTRRNGHDDGTD